MSSPRPTLTEQLDELRAELRREPLIDLDYLLSAEARRHAGYALATAALVFVASYFLVPQP